MKLPSRRTREPLGITRPRGEKAQWKVPLLCGTFVFVISMSINLTGVPPWTVFLVCAASFTALGVLYLAVLRPSDKAKRKIAPTRSTRALVLFTGIAGAVVLSISAGTLPWGYSPAWGLAAAALFVPSILAFLVIRPRTKKSDAGEAPPATSPSQ